MGKNLKRPLSLLALVGLGLAALALSAFGGSGTQVSSGSRGTRTIYNYCQVSLYNNVPHTLKLTHIEKHSHDTWEKYRSPRDLIPPFNTNWGSPNDAISESGFARGCWTILRWGDSHGTVETYAFDPYNGPNRYHCKTTGEYRCFEQEKPANPPYGFEHQRLTGDYLLLNYKLCMIGKHCPGPHNPSVHYP